MLKKKKRRLGKNRGLKRAGAEEEKKTARKK